VARILIVGGGCRGRQLADELVGEGHVLRVTTRSEERRAAIEAGGAECWIATPARVGTLRPALEGVTLACWLLALASGEEGELRALHGSRLELFAQQLIDTTVRGFIYDSSPGVLPGELLAEGRNRVRVVTERNAIPTRVIDCAQASDAGDEGWIVAARGAVESLLAGRSGG
jgi:uncharacterized protein YbjT (DUF2867 family)